jgi:hypothetical protein
MLHRRRALYLLAATALLPAAGARTQALPAMRVLKDPYCGCCGSWIDHIRAAGFTVEAIDEPDMAAVKARLGVPADLASCHTALIEGYVVEGHVPASAIHQLLAVRPDATGLSVPGMPIGSPGMEVPGLPDEIYDVLLFAPNGTRTIARYQGTTRL